MFTNPNGGSGYLFGAKLPSAHVNLAWSYLPKALDGIGGGSYTLVSQLTLGGAGLGLTGALHELAGTFTVLSGGFVTVASGGAISLASGGAISLASGSSIAWTSGASETGTKTEAANVTQTGMRTLSTHGLIKVRRFVLDGLTDPGPLAISSLDGDLFVQTAMGSGGALVMGITSSQTNHIVEVMTRGMTGGHTLDVFADDGITLLFSMTASTNCYARFFFDGTDWRLLFKSN